MKTPSSAYISSYNDVTTDNLSECVYELLNKLKNASHMAIDFEFTGLCKPTAIDMNHRYIAMKEAVEKYSIVSFGVSIMKQIESDHDEPKNSIRYECDNFNFLTKKESRIVFQEGNVEFLASTGFSFDKLNRMGIPFTPPGDIGKDDNFLYNKQKPRDTRLLKLWKAILGMLQYNNIPVIVHNGLHDIMYLYHSFIDKLPNNFTVFLTNLSQHFPSGFYDTKLLSIEIEFSANFLSYVFAKTDRLRQNRFANSTAKEPYFEVILNKPIVSSEDDKSNHSIETTTEVTVVTSVTETNQTEASQQPTVTTSTDRKRKKDETVEVNTLSIVNNNKKQKTKEADFCKAFAAKGWCPISRTGNLDHSDSGRMHDLQRILDFEMGTSIYPQVYTSDAVQMKNMEKAHAAHFDAYMTAFVFCYFKHTFLPAKLQEHYNKIRLDFAPYALTIPTKSTKKTK